MEAEKTLMKESQEANPKTSTGARKNSQKKTGRRARRASGKLVIMQRRYVLIAIFIVLCCSVYLVIRTSSTEKASPTLLKAFIGFRHGSRAPSFSYKGDKYKNIEKFIPEGRNKLTKIGKQEAYALGKRLRERYDEFLGPIYRPEEVLTYTTIMERSMMSGLLVMASLFPPTGYQIWDEELKWQPVPMYPEYIFNTSVGGSCPKFRMVAFKNAIGAYDKLSPADQEIVMHVKDCAGEANNSNYEAFSKVYDTVYFQYKANLPLPDCLNSVFPEKMMKVAVKFLKTFLFSTEVQRQILLWNYAVALRDFFHSDLQKKMEIHSWHDLNNIAMFEMLGINIEQFQEPTSCIAIELHERNGQKYFEAYYYDNYKSKQPRQLEMGCGMSCSFEELNKIAEQFQVEGYKALCENATISSRFPKLDVLA